MYSMVIADDEKLVIDGLVTTIDWKDHQIQIVGTALDGNSAYDLIKKTEPNIVMVDIRMPGLNGLDLIQKVKGIYPDTAFIIISGYTDFSYAKRAMKLQAVDYLTKPIELDEIVETVERAIERYDKLKEERLMNDKIQSYQFKIEEKYILDSILGQQLDKPQALRALETSTTFVCGFNGSKWSIELRNNMQHYIHLVKERLQSRNLLPFAYVLEEQLVVTCANTRHEQEVYIAIMELSQLLEKEFGIVPNIGVGNMCSLFSKIQSDYAEAKAAYQIGVFLNKGVTYFIDTEQLNHHIGSEMIERIDSSFKEKEFDLTQLAVMIEELLAYSVQQKLTPIKTKYLCFKLINNIYDFVQGEFDLNLERLIDEKYVMYRHLNELRSIEELRVWLLELVNKILAYLNENQVSQKDKLILDVKSYINNHYHKVITLDEVAEQFHISGAYLSSLFSKKESKTMFEYIIDLRITAAKELLRTSNYKISEICHQVGYENQRYFNQVFKKHVGISPGKYRTERSMKQQTAPKKSSL